MEAFTSGRVSPAARRAYIDHWKALRPDVAEQFAPVRGGYRMVGWESNIRYARAMGRGVRSGQGRPPHHYDR